MQITGNHRVIIDEIQWMSLMCHFLVVEREEEEKEISGRGRQRLRWRDNGRDTRESGPVEEDAVCGRKWKETETCRVIRTKRRRCEEGWRKEEIVMECFVISEDENKNDEMHGDVSLFFC